jgi:TetR/AcrR family hemagglutinin/protease transcriptional regulator
MNLPMEGKRRLAKEERHAQLLSYAVSVAARKGLGQIVHADIAEAAGIVPPTVFRYFPSREALMREIVAEVGRFYREQSDGFHSNPDDPDIAIHDHLQAFSHSIDTHRDYAAVWLQWGASVQNDCGIWDMFQEHNEYLIRSVSRTIRQGFPEERRRDYAVSKSRAQNLLGVAFAITMLKLSNASEDAISRLISVSLTDIFAG